MIKKLIAGCFLDSGFSISCISISCVYGLFNEGTSIASFNLTTSCPLNWNTNVSCFLLHYRRILVFKYNQNLQ